MDRRPALVHCQCRHRPVRDRHGVLDLGARSRRVPGDECPAGELVRALRGGTRISPVVPGHASLMMATPFVRREAMARIGESNRVLISGNACRNQAQATPSGDCEESMAPPSGPKSGVFLGMKFRSSLDNPQKTLPQIIVCGYCGTRAAVDWLTRPGSTTARVSSQGPLRVSESCARLRRRRSTALAVVPATTRILTARFVGGTHG